MAESFPLGESTSVELDFEYDVSEDWIEHHMIDTGTRPPSRWRLHVNLAEVPLSSRRQILEAHRIYKAVPWYPELYEPTDDPDDVAQSVLARHESEAAQEEHAAQEDVLARVAEDDEQARYERERDRWVAEQGSARLRLGNQRDYNMNRVYLLERSVVDLPGFWIDIADSAEWKPRANPTEQALVIEANVLEHIPRFTPDGFDPPEVRIIWLTTFPKDMERASEESDEYWPEQMEAVSIRRWLGRYDAVLPVAPEYRANEEIAEVEE